MSGQEPSRPETGGALTTSSWTVRRITPVEGERLNGLAGRSHDRAALVAATMNSGGNDGGFRTEPGEHIVSGHYPSADDPLLPLGQDSKRYRVIGNGVATPVAFWIGRRLMAYLDGTL